VKPRLTRQAEADSVSVRSVTTFRTPSRCPADAGRGAARLARRRSRRRPGLQRVLSV